MPDRKMTHRELLRALRETGSDQGRSREDMLEALRAGIEVCPFNSLIGMKVVSLSADQACIRIDMRDDLVGNQLKHILHGGVISSVLDVVGSMAVAIGIMDEMTDRPIDQVFKRYLRMGTIDLRVDFLRPARGHCFLATGSLVRTGGSVAVSRMELRNQEKDLIAVGTAAYKVG